MVNGWKVTAIIFIVLFIVETSLFIWAINVGSEMIDNENECAYNICEDYETYFYDDTDKMCYCYKNHELEHQKYMG